MTQDEGGAMDQHAASEMLKHREPLVGTWAAGTARTAWRTVEWHAAGAHLVQWATSETPLAGGSTAGVGCRSVAGTYVQLYSDDRGTCRIYSVTDGTWLLWRAPTPVDVTRDGGALPDEQPALRRRYALLTPGKVRGKVGGSPGS